ncbi:N-(5'-phosphoribosyl)anthranilate isomerase [Kordia antarctica]|uniref:N-(5'-phosphoribosyl)anthranilate isomerase n=1 Tax=Kordia antarctica TaxID=1218801 RepID=A0A7L4ZQ11_9FLAO|nr:phosphoribosylanthranilate isomerase [Kordia antarctica]QHI38725.1 N-(5'-phosphoribosyl)anthranilate isomerase [Kordia antarctica]
MKYEDNMIAISELQPDYLGFIFYKKSLRFFDAHIPEIPKSIKKTGVFVNSSQEEIIEKVIQHDLLAVQLHGSESPEFCSELKDYISTPLNVRVEIIKVFSIKDEFDFTTLKQFEAFVDYFLFDTKGRLPGGNGVTFDWKVLENYPSEKPFFLSGGIGLETIPKLEAFLNSKASKYCYALDINSKFEIAPGLKNVEELTTFKKAIS